MVKQNKHLRHPDQLHLNQINMKKLLILPLLFLVCALHAQTKPTQHEVDSIRAVIVAELTPKINDLITEKPVILICFNERLNTAHLFTIKGYARAGVFYDNRHRQLADWVTVFQAIEPKKKGDKKP